MRLINLTPHPFTLIWTNADGEEDVMLELPGCDNPPRAKETRERKGALEVEVAHSRAYHTNIPINRVFLGEVENLPEPKEDTAYVVSRVVAEACPDRNDLFVPDETVRDEKGRIIGCRALAKI